MDGGFTVSLAADARILVIRRDNIGDLICTTPALHLLRQALPQAAIEVLVNEYNAPILDGNPDVDAVHVYAKAKHRRGAGSRLAAYAARAALLLRLRARRYDVAILASHTFEKYALRTARLTGARRIVGYAPKGGPIPGALDCPVPQAPGLEHEVLSVCRLLAPLGIAAAPGRLVLQRDAQRIEAVRAILAGRVGTGRRRIIGIHISAREDSRRWPIAKFIELVRSLDQPDAVCLLFWSPGAADNPYHPGDDAQAAKVLAECPPDRVIPFPTADLAQLNAGIACCNALICADGGALHVAAALGVPVVGLFENRPEKLERWYPWQVPHAVLHADDGIDVGGIDVARVRSELRRLLAQAQA